MNRPVITPNTRPTITPNGRPVIGATHKPAAEMPAAQALSLAILLCDFELEEATQAKPAPEEWRRELVEARWTLNRLKSELSAATVLME